MYFFFSSRRRHTRYIGDWSSDVCSSDLRRISSMCSPRGRTDVRQVKPCEPATCTPLSGSPPGARRNVSTPARHIGNRSEERRVGKSVELGGGRTNKKKKLKRTT